MKMEDYKIIVRNTCIIINDYELGSNRALEKPFTVWDQLTHQTYYIGLYYDKTNRRLFLPRGIDLWYVQRCLDNIEPHIEKCDPYEKIGPILIKTLPRNEKQKTALRFMLSQGEFKDNRYKSQLSVNLPTGTGKTYCAVATSSFEEIRTIIITYSNNWLDQWKERITQYTDIKEKDIYKIDGSGSINMLLSGKSKNCDRKVYLVTHSTLKSFGDRYGWYQISELFRKLKIGLKYYDEAHLNFANMCMVDFFTNTYRTYYITATPDRSNMDEDKIFQLFMKNIPSIELFDSETDPHTHYISFKYNSNPNPQEVSNCKGAYGLDRMKYISYLMNKPNFWKMFDVIFTNIVNSKYNGKALFYIGTNDGILKVRDHIVRLYPEFKNDIGIYTTLSGNEKNAEKEKRFILSTTKSAGAAEDISELRFTVVVAEPFKSKVLAKQSLGRTRGDDTFYYDMVDMGFSYTKKYYYAKYEVFNKYAIDMSDNSFNNIQLANMAERYRIKRMNRWKNAVSYDYKKEAISFDYHKQEAFFFTRGNDEQG